MIGHGGKCLPCRLILSTSSSGKTSNNTKKINNKGRQEDNTAALGAESEIKRKRQKGYGTQLRSVIKVKMYTRMKFVKSEQLALYVTKLFSQYRIYIPNTEATTRNLITSLAKCCLQLIRHSTNLVNRKGRELISEIHSVTDEALGLLVIYNEHHV